MRDDQLNGNIILEGFESVVANTVYSKSLGPSETDVIMIHKFSVPTEMDIFLSLNPYLQKIANFEVTEDISRLEHKLRCLTAIDLYKLHKNYQEARNFSANKPSEINLQIRCARLPSSVVEDFINGRNPHYGLSFSLPSNVYYSHCYNNPSNSEWFTLLFDHVSYSQSQFGEKWSKDISLNLGLLSGNLSSPNLKDVSELEENSVISLILSSLQKEPLFLDFLDDLTSEKTKLVMENFVAQLHKTSSRKRRDSVINQKRLYSLFRNFNPYPLSQLHGDEALPN